MTEFNYYQDTAVYKSIYLQFPIAFIKNQTYSKMSAEAKIAYVVLKDRLRYSLQNHWVDSEGHVYFIYTNEELCDLLNCAKPKAIKIKKELEALNLLMQVRIGVNKPNHLYLADIEIRPEEIYTDQPQNATTVDNSGSNKILLPENGANSGSNKTLLPGKSTIVQSETRANSGSNKMLPNLDSIDLDFKDFKDLADSQNKQLEQREQDQDRELLQNLPNLLLEADGYGEFTEPILKTVSLFAINLEDAMNTLKIVKNAKKNVEALTNEFIITWEWTDQINAALKRFYLKRKTDSRIKNQDNYLFGIMKTCFSDYLAANHARDTDAAEN
ncbi:replication initiator protein A [Lapidilactobacillus bayanensis]|uniref:replication initiator protein A n=1 Tax=Lapidilactobacillus bayanensis TaxID=2485998 RepID=UPI000F78C371|nr:replication initiator protein A [Lapidilactobacillus bayanensis]